MQATIVSYKLCYTIYRLDGFFWLLDQAPSNMGKTNSTKQLAKFQRLRWDSRRHLNEVLWLSNQTTGSIREMVNTE